MASTFTAYLNLEKQGAGDNSGTWGTVLNANYDILDNVASGATAITPDINGGTVDGAVVGGATPAAGTFTTLTANTSLTAATADINGGTVDGAAIGASVASSGAFTTVAASGDVDFNSGGFFFDQSTSRVGIGTNSPDAEIHIVGNNPDLRLTDSGGTNQFTNIQQSGKNIIFDIRDDAADGGFLIRGNAGGSPTQFFRVFDDGKISIGTAASSTVSLEVGATDAVALPSGTTAQRPTGVAGYFRYNSTEDSFEGYTTADGWGAVGGGGGASTVIDYQEFTTSGTWTKPAGAASGDKVKVQVVGGGGGGGSSGTGSPGGGGGGGAIALFDDVDDLPASAATVVGAGGAGPSGNGGTSSFGTSGDEWFLQATGGVAGGTGFNSPGGVGGTVRYGRTNGNDQGDAQDGGQGGESSTSPFVGSASITGGGGGGGAATNNTNSTGGGPSMMAGAGGQGGGSGLTTERQGRFPGGGGGGRDTSYGGSIGDGANGVVRVWVIRE